MPRCTCGRCVGGFLSPRNGAALLEASTTSAGLLRDSMPTFPADGSAIHDPPVFLLDYVPPELRMEVTKPFVEGFANCMDTVAYALKQGQTPKPRVVAQCAGFAPGLDKEASKFYLNNRGAAEYALDAVLAQCEEGAGGSAGDSDLPACDNDGHWELVRQQLFSNSSFWPCGPYPLDDDEEGWGGAADDQNDGWVHYDTSNWKPPPGHPAHQ